MSDEPLRMNAYYYSFDPTGERVIDVVLSAVAWAGKAHHHTQYWTDTDLGESQVQQIQGAADNAAREVATLRARVAELEAALRAVIAQARPPNGSGLHPVEVVFHMERIALAALAARDGGE